MGVWRRGIPLPMSGVYHLPGVCQLVGEGAPSLAPVGFLCPRVPPSAAVPPLRQYSLSLPSSQVSGSPFPAGFSSRSGQASEVSAPEVVWSTFSLGRSSGLAGTTGAITCPGVGFVQGGRGRISVPALPLSTPLTPPLHSVPYHLSPPPRVSCWWPGCWLRGFLVLAACYLETRSTGTWQRNQVHVSC